jgi:cysteine synthase
MIRKFWLIVEVEFDDKSEVIEFPLQTQQRLAKVLEHSSACEALSEAMQATVRLRLAIPDEMRRESADLLREMGEAISSLMDSAELSQVELEPETAELIDQIRARAFPLA